MSKHAIISLHIGYWFLMLFQVLLVSLGTGVLGSQIDWHLFLTIVLPVRAMQLACSAAFFYVNYLLLIPLLLKRNKLIPYLLSLCCCIVVFAPLYYVMEQYIYPVIGWKSYSADLNIYFSLMITLSSNFVNIFLGILLSFLMDWRRTRMEKEIIEKEQVKTELAFLKSQVNPHFLFNTINDIYSLTQQQSKFAPEALLKLSELLRYMLRESDDAFVLLVNEITYLENVIGLHKIGQKGTSFIDLDISGDPGSLKIAPLILINFIENVFKHGIFNSPEAPIIINITIEDQVLHLQIHNKINRLRKDKTGGIGLVNVKRRLSLIYPQKHKLLINQQTDSFAVDLKIDLL